MAISNLKNLKFNWKQTARELSKILKRVLDYKTELLEISDGTLAAIPLMNNKTYLEYLFRGIFKEGSFYVFKHKEYKNSYLISFYLNDIDYYKTHIVSCAYVFYMTCYKLFINVKLHRIYENKDNLSFHYIVNPNKVEFERFEYELENEKILSGDDLVKLSLRIISIEEETIQKSNKRN